MTDTFVHLHLHTEYSLANSVVRIKDLANRVSELEMPAVAITDPVNLYGMVKFYRRMVNSGIKPIVGADVWVVNPANLNAPYRLVLLVQDRQGYRNICSLISRAHQESQHSGRACVVKEWLHHANEGLIALSGAQDGDIGQALRSGGRARVDQLVEEYRQIFGDRFYLELQRVGRQYEDEHIHAAVDLAARRGIPVVATNDVHFLSEQEFGVHEVRVCIHEGRVLNDPRRQRRFTPQQYLRSPAEMSALFSDIPEAIQNSVEIAKRCNFFLEIGDYYLPNFPVPENLTPEQFLREKSHGGLAQRLRVNDIAAIDAYRERLERELDVIAQMGFPGYFLIVADFIQWAKNNGIPVGPGRGSGAGSLVAYALGITELDPIQHGLLFERFLNPERVSLPDFDIDFCIEGRDRVIDYVADYYGREKVSQIITHGTMAARAVVRDVGRVMGMTYGHVDKIAKLIPFEVGMTLDQALKQEDLLKENCDKDDDVKQLLEIARALEGLPRNVGKHAGGVVIAPSALTEFTALYCDQGSDQTVTQLDKDDLEAIGLVKFDFLGLRTLTIIDKTLKTVNLQRKSRDEEPIVLDELNIDDPESYQLLKSCRTTALFQLESRGMKDLIQRLQPDCFDDLVALVALYRPGPLQSGMVEDFIDRKHGRARLSYSHPALEPILKPTYGVILYQEQVMEIARVLAGYSLGSADLLRRAMGKKKHEEMARQREVFLHGAHERGVKERTASGIFDLMEKFAGYGFNKSHSAAYALITYQTAYLKAHYPAQFMAAALSADMEHTDKVVTLIAECREMGLEVLSPDINHCKFAFEATQDSKILYGLGAVKGIGYAVIEAVVEARNQGEEFSDLFDLCERVDVKRVNRRAMESLIKSGALDKLGAHRASLNASLNTALSVSGQQSSNRSAGQTDLFGVSAPQQTVRAYRAAPEWSKEQVLAGEKETLGLYLSGHPVDAYRAELAQLTDACLSELRPSEDRHVVVAGLVVGLRMMNTRRGDRMAFVTLDDKTARLEIAVFSELFSKSRDALRKDNLLIVQGSVSVDEYTGGFKMAAEQIYDIEEVRSIFAAKLVIRLTADNISQELYQSLEHALERSETGGCRVVFQYVTPSEQVTLPAGQRWRVNPTGQLLGDLEELVGENAVGLVYKPITFVGAAPVASTA